MASAYGENHGLVCGGCGLKYDNFRTGMTWTQVRNDIIAIKVDRHTGKTKYGRRRGVLGWWFELKRAMFDQHVGECTDAAEGQPHAMLGSLVAGVVSNTKKERSCPGDFGTGSNGSTDRKSSRAKNGRSKKRPRSTRATSRLQRS